MKLIYIFVSSYARNQFSCNKAHTRTPYVWDVIRSKREKVISPCSEYIVFLVTRRHAKFILNYMYLSWAQISILIKVACSINLDQLSTFPLGPSES